jgi:peptide/nickel transport system permease protein
MATRSTIATMLAEARRNQVAMIGFGISLFVVLAIVFGPWISPYDPLELDLSFMFILEAPSWEHPFGTDSFGRDVITRALYGARTSILVSFAGVAIGGTAGTLIGMVSAYVGRSVDAISMRFVDLVFAFPILALGIFLLLVLGSGIHSVIVTIAIIYIPNFARLARNTTMLVKEEPYIQAAKLMGQSTLRILTREILPNIAGPMFVQLTVGFAFGIVIEAGLSFLGLGVQPPDVSLGTMMAEGKDYFMRGPWVVTFSGLTLTVIILGLNLMGDGLRDLLDPRLRRRTAV